MDCGSDVLDGRGLTFGGVRHGDRIWQEGKASFINLAR